MKAILLAAGRGTRLGPLGHDRPKCLLPIDGVTLLDYFCASLRATGVVSEIIVVGGYCVETLRRHLPEDVTLVENSRYATTNSLYSLWLALQTFEGEDFAVFNADVIYQPNLLGRFLHHPVGTACLVDELRRFDPCEFHVAVEDGLVRQHDRGVCEGASHGQCAQAFKVAAEHAPPFKDRVRALIESRAENSYACAADAVLIERRLLRPIYTNDEAWSEVDTEADYRKCREIFEVHDPDAQHLSSYGLRHAGPGAAPRRTRPPRPPSLGARLRRGLGSIEHGHLPWRLRWAPELMRATARSPLRSLSYAWPLATGVLSPEGFKLRLYGPALLGTVMEEATALGMRPFLLWGSLLGCVREGNFIRRDHDIDLGLLDPDFQKAGALRDRLVARGLRLRQSDEYKISFLSGGGDGVFVDIDRVYEERGHMVIANGSADSLLLYTYPFPRRVFASIATGSLGGVEVGLPAEPETFLEVVYGNWRVPQKKREYLRGPLNLRLEPREARPRTAPTPSPPRLPIDARQWMDRTP